MNFSNAVAVARGGAGRQGVFDPMPCSSSEAYLACCLAGLGLIQAPRDGLQPLLAEGVIEEVLPRWRPAPLPVSLLYPQQGRQSPRVRAFADWLVEVLQPGA